MPTVNDIYQQVLRRPAEPEGLAYWKSVFGDYVDDTELAQFKAAAAPELVQRGALPEDIMARVAASPDVAVKIGDTWYQGIYDQQSGSGETFDRGPLTSYISYTDAENRAGGQYTKYDITGEKAGTGVQQKVNNSVLPFLLAAGGLALGLPGIGEAAGGGGLLGAGGAGTTGLTLSQLGGTAGATALTAAETAALAGTGGVGLGGSLVGTVAGTGTGTGITVGGAGGLGGASGVAGLGTGVGTGLTTAGVGGLGGATGAVGLGGATGAGLTTAGGLTGTGVLTGSTLGTGLLGTTGTTALTGTGVLTGSTLGTQLLGTGAGTAATVGGVTGLTNAANLGAGALTTGVGAGLGTAAGTAAGATLAGLTPAQLGALISTGLNTGAGLLQQQTSRDAALAAQAMIEKETAAAKLGAQFRPIGMTTRFGTSNFAFDPVTGRMIDANYILSSEAKAQQDRLMALANAGLTQAEGAQAQFAPLQTGAQSLFGLGQGYLNATTDPRLAEIASQYLAQSPESQRLTALGGNYLTASPESQRLTALGSQYLAQSPEQVAQNYLNQQMALLQPGRETELANLQNKLQQQGRGGLSVAQGGSYGATTPELQALYNARAMQEAQLAAGAQQAGQQQIQFGAGLVGTGQQLGMAGQQFGANLIGSGQQLGIAGQQFGMNTLAAQQALEQQRIGFGSGLFNQGAGLMGQYYAGQQAAYAPYTTALGQVQALETAGQQPFNTSLALAQQQAKAGFDVGQLGLSGAKLSTALSTGNAATTNPYSTLLSGLGGSPAFGTAAGNIFSGLFS